MSAVVIRLTWNTSEGKEIQKNYSYNLKNAFNSLLLGQLNDQEGIICSFSEKADAENLGIEITLKSGKTRADFNTLFNKVLGQLTHIAIQ